MKLSLAERQARIENEIEYLDIKPYSNTIIMLNLQIIEKDFGRSAANKTIRRLGLRELGWKVRR